MNTTSSDFPIYRSNSMVDSKHAVAEILSSMTSGPLTPTTLTSGIEHSFSTAAINVTTPTLTPTTLHNFEQTLMDLSNPTTTTNTSSNNNYNFGTTIQPAGYLNLHQPQNISSESGFIPPVIAPINSAIPAMVQVKEEIDDSEYYNNSSVSGAKRRKNADGSYVVPNIDPDTYLVKNSRRPTGPRKIKKVESLTPEEEAKREQRRERNKYAAAKCRNKREDITARLINETEGLEEEKANWENEIQTLLQQKEQLEFLLESHKASCQKQQHHHLHQNQTIQQQLVTSVKMPNSNILPVNTTYQQPPQLQQYPQVRMQQQQPPQYIQPLAQRSNIMNNRPISLPIPNTLPSLGIPSATYNANQSTSVVTEALGVTINTPSTGIPVFNFDTLLEGHTGLTPTTAVPFNTGAPNLITSSSSSFNPRSCATQQRSTDSSSSNELSSPTLTY